MSGLINELVAILQEQAENYENLLALSAEKKEVILSNEIKELQKITSIENVIVGKNQNLEKRRIKAIRNISIVLNTPEDELTLTKLLELITGQPEHQSLFEASERIRKVVYELKEANDQIKVLINNSLEYIEFTINLIRDAVSNDPAAYSMDGTQIGTGNVFFDAKQ